MILPATFKDDIHVVLLFNVVNPDTFNDDKLVESVKKNDWDDKLFIANIEFRLAGSRRWIL